MMIDWEKIDTVLLDMDGTLLDLNFDNHFWHEFVPLKYAEQHNISVESAKMQLRPQFKSMEGKLEWYCLDYWSEALNLNITELKVEISGLIAILPHVTEFLEKLQQSSQKVILVTNAHRDSLDLKMEKTCLQRQQSFDKNTTVLIDDSLAVLNSAQLFGIKHLISVSKPDTQQPIRTILNYPAIEDFRELMVGL